MNTHRSVDRHNTLSRSTVSVGEEEEEEEEEEEGLFKANAVNWEDKEDGLFKADAAMAPLSAWAYVTLHRGHRGGVDTRWPSGGGRGGGRGGGGGSQIKADAVNEEDPERDRATQV